MWECSRVFSGTLTRCRVFCSINRKRDRKKMSLNSLIEHTNRNAAKSFVTSIIKRLLSFVTFLIGGELSFAFSIIAGVILFFFGTAPAVCASERLDLPRCSVVIERVGYQLSFDPRTKTARWVHEEITEKSLKGSVSREGFSFKEDPTIPTLFRSKLSDYKGSGFDRGHLAPATNHRADKKTMEETFFLSNMCPQAPEFNRGYWNKVEAYVRGLAGRCDKVDVYTGALFLPQVEADGSRWVKYRVIGDNEVAVPSHFYKVIFLSALDTTESEAFIIPNQRIDPKTPLKNFKTTIEKVEKAAGVLFPRQARTCEFP